MITERDLQEAIAECKGKRNPDSSTCIKLAAFLTIQRELFGNPEQLGYSYSPPVETIERTINFPGDTEFSRAVDGMDAKTAWKVMDELMSTISVLNPPLYEGVMRKLRG